MANDDRALLVGISRYPAVRSLEGPENDTDEFRKWLILPDGGNLDPNNVKTIVSSDFATDDQSRHPALDDINDFFLDLMQKQHDTGLKRIGRRLYLFLSGHGVGAALLSQAALCMANSNTALKNYPAFGGQLYADDIGNRGMFEEVFLWMDCCRQTLSFVNIFPLSWSPPDPKIPPRRFFWAFATTPGELGAEAQMSINGGPSRPHGVFSALFFEALAKCKTRRGGQVCASDVGNYIYPRMIEVLGPSAPSPQFQRTATQDMVLFKRTEGLTAVTLHIPGVPSGKLRILTGQNENALDDLVDIKDGLATVQLEAGIYKAVVEYTVRSGLFGIPGGPDVHIS